MSGVAKFVVGLFLLIFGVGLGLLSQELVNFDSKKPTERNVKLSDLFGTMAEFEGQDFSPVESLQIELEQISGSVTLSKSNSFYFLEVDVANKAEIAGEVIFDPAKFDVISLWNQNETPDNSVQICGDSFSFTNKADNKYHLLLKSVKDGESSLMVQFVEKGTIIMNEYIDIN